MAPAISRHIKFFFIKIHRDSVTMRGFVRNDLGREPVPDVLMVAM
jgi:hypothetical protein